MFTVLATRVFDPKGEESHYSPCFGWWRTKTIGWRALPFSLYVSVFETLFALEDASFQALAWASETARNVFRSILAMLKRLTLTEVEPPPWEAMGGMTPPSLLTVLTAGGQTDRLVPLN